MAPLELSDAASSHELTRPRRGRRRVTSSQSPHDLESCESFPELAAHSKGDTLPSPTRRLDDSKALSFRFEPVRAGPDVDDQRHVELENPLHLLANQLDGLVGKVGVGLKDQFVVDLQEHVQRE